jgi:ABC-type nickel/cobalt efflux system permease component RcnA
VALLAVPLALLLWLGGSVAAALGHPLGNFTINHYAGLRVSPDAIQVDVVMDYAEIPAFQERQQMDGDGDGDVSDAEAAADREPRCRELAGLLTLARDGQPLQLELVADGLTFPPGAGGLATMRLVCEYRAEIRGGLTSATAFTFADGSYAERIGWREIVVLGDDMTISGSDAVADTSARLTTYPQDLLAQPLDVRRVAFSASPGGSALEPFVAPDASPLEGSPSATPPATGFDPGSVPGGVGADIPELFRSASLTPILAVASILLAAALGAGHALTPGHGKTLMAAYLVGRRGTIRHAIGLGLSVTVSHTLGILLLALLVTGAEAALPADVVVRTVPVLAALGFVAIGAWMIVSEVRRRRSGTAAAPHVHDHEPHTHEPFEHEHPHDTEHEHGHPHEHDHEPELDHGAGLEHEHGGLRHRHGLAPGEAITWRSLFALGLAGGIIPSTNALIILLGALVAGRAAFGIVLVIAFGLGMALVLGGVGVALVLVRGRLERVPSSPRVSTALANAPLVASVLVFGIGL